MKKMRLTGLICVFLLVTPVFGEVSIRNDSAALPSVPGVSGAVIGTACVEGYVFVYAWGNGNIVSTGGAGVGMSLVQVYEERAGKVVPKKCSP
jgi:hypothetical protein